MITILHYTNNTINNEQLLAILIRGYLMLIPNETIQNYVKIFNNVHGQRAKDKYEEKMFNFLPKVGLFEKNTKKSEWESINLPFNLQERLILFEMMPEKIQQLYKQKWKILSYQNKLVEIEKKQNS